MPKSNSKSNSRSRSKGTRGTSTKSKLNSSTPGRPRPMAPKAGVTVERRRYDKGGKWCW